MLGELVIMFWTNSAAARIAIKPHYSSLLFYFFLIFVLSDISSSSTTVSLCLNPNLRDVNGIEILYLIVDGVVVLVLSTCLSGHCLSQRTSFHSISFLSFLFYHDISSFDILMFLFSFNLQAGGFSLLVIGPSYIPANEVSLFFLIETILGKQLLAAITSQRHDNS